MDPHRLADRPFRQSVLSRTDDAPLAHMGHHLRDGHIIIGLFGQIEEQVILPFHLFRRNGLYGYRHLHRAGNMGAVLIQGVHMRLIGVDQHHVHAGL